MIIPTPHIEAKEKDIIAKTVLMPGDPLRAKFIADNFLYDVIQFNSIRNMLGYTGFYKGKKVSIMGSGMGMPSIGIYSYELYNNYEVDNIIRIGTCGTYTKELNVYDVVLATEAWSESTYAKVQSGYEKDTISSSEDLTNKLYKTSKELNIPLTRGKVHSHDVFYRQNLKEHYSEIFRTQGCIAAEMEAFALFANAKLLNKNAACILTVAGSIITGERATSEEREKSFWKMINIALNSI